MICGTRPTVIIITDSLCAGGCVVVRSIARHRRKPSSELTEANFANHTGNVSTYLETRFSAQERTCERSGTKWASEQANAQGYVLDHAFQAATPNSNAIHLPLRIRKSLFPSSTMTMWDMSISYRGKRKVWLGEPRDLHSTAYDAGERRKNRCSHKFVSEKFPWVFQSFWSCCIIYVNYSS